MHRGKEEKRIKRKVNVVEGTALDKLDYKYVGTLSSGTVTLHLGLVLYVNSESIYETTIWKIVLQMEM